MKKVLLIFSIFISVYLYADVQSPRDGSWNSKYIELQQLQLSPDSLRAVLSALSIPPNEKAYFDFLLMKAYGDNWDLEHCDSLHKITSSGFVELQNPLMKFEVDYTLGSYMNAFHKYEDAYVVLGDLAKGLQPYTLSTKDKSKYQQMYANTLYELSYSLLYLNGFEEANQHINQATDLFAQLGDSLTLMEAYNLSGLLYKRQFMLDKAIERYKQAMEMSETLGNVRLTKIIINNIASLYTELEENEKALEMGRRVIQDYPYEEAEGGNAKIERIVNLNTLGVLLGNANLPQNAVDTLQLAAHSFDEKIPSGLKLLVYSNLAKSFNACNVIDSTFYYYQKAISYKNTTKNEYNKANLNFLYGTLLANKTDSTLQARRYLEDALDYYRQVPSQLLLKTLLELSQLEANRFHDYKKAYQLAKEAYDFEQTSDFENYQKKLANFEAEFKTKEKEVEIANLNATREKEQAAYKVRMILALSLIVIISLLILALFFYMRKKRAVFKLKELSLQNEIEQRELKTQLLIKNMNHEMTQRYINGLEDSNQRMAKELHDGVCHKLLFLEMNLNRLIPANMVGELAQVREDVRSLSHQLATPDFKDVTLLEVLGDYIERLSETVSFDIDYTVDERIEELALDSKVEFEIYRLIQEAVNNILKHANPQMVNIAISTNQNKITIRIKDDGKGFDTTTRKAGLGLRTMQERVNSLQGDLEITSKPGKGTCVTFEFPCVPLKETVSVNKMN